MTLFPKVLREFLGHKLFSPDENMMLSRFYLIGTLLLVGLHAGETLESVLARHEAAVGGAKAWRAIEGMQLTGTLKIHSCGEELPFAMLLTRKMVRMEYGSGSTRVVQLYDGKKGWQQDLKQGVSDPKPLTRQETNGLLEMTDLEGPLVESGKKANKLSYLGLLDFEGAKYHTIRVELVSGSREDYYLDPQTHLAKVVVKTYADGEKTEVGKMHSYEKVHGVWMAKHMTFGCFEEKDSNKAKSFIEWYQVRVQSRKINPKVDESMFCFLKTRSLIAEKSP